MDKGLEPAARAAFVLPLSERLTDAGTASLRLARQHIILLGLSIAISRVYVLVGIKAHYYTQYDDISTHSCIQSSVRCLEQLEGCPRKEKKGE